MLISSFFMARPTGWFPFDDAQLSASDLASKIHFLLRTQPPSSPAVSSAFKRLKELRACPPCQLVSAHIWGQAFLRRPQQLNATFSNAAANVVEATGRPLNSTDEDMLRRLLTHLCGWSATKPKHMTDGWVPYVQRYAMNPEMSPILDSIAFPEDVEWFDADYEPQHPS
jgi:hypothetical protein